jgi:type II secretory ATPase GspE/PulE/Tfp pilus assembly ATPase PilB-like protein
VISSRWAGAGTPLGSELIILDDCEVILRSDFHMRMMDRKRSIRGRIDDILREVKRRRILSKARKLRSTMKMNARASDLIREDRDER